MQNHRAFFESSNFIEHLRVFMMNAVKRHFRLSITYIGLFYNSTWTVVILNNFCRCISIHWHKCSHEYIMFYSTILKNMYNEYIILQWIKWTYIQIQNNTLWLSCNRHRWHKQWVIALKDNSQHIYMHAGGSALHPTFSMDIY